MRPITCLVAVPSLCVGAGGAHAQSAFFLRLAPEVGRITVEHTKKVTIQGESSSSISSSSGLALAANLSAGLRLKLLGNWLLGGELEGITAGRRKLKGTISPTPNGNIHDGWPGLAARGGSTFSELRWYPPVEAAKGSLSWVFRAKQPESVRTGP